MKIVLLGAGNVGYHLARALTKQNLGLVQLFNRTKAAAKELSEATNGIAYTTDYAEILAHADLYIIAVKDDVISDVARQLTKHLGNDILVVHTSGTVSTLDLAPFADRFGSFYPLQTFSKTVPVDFQTVPICLTAHLKSDLLTLEKLAKDLGCVSYPISDQQRQVLHVSSVIACNFTNYLLGVSRDLLVKENIPYEIIHPLIKETIRKAINFVPQEVQTGPAIRKDTKTLQHHLDFLESFPPIQHIYRLISEAIAGK